MASPITVDIEGRYNDRDINRAMADLRKLQASGMGVGAKMQAVGDKMQAVGASIAKVGKSMTLGVTLPIVGVGVAATKMAMDFDESMTKMVSLVGLSRDEVNGMRGDIIAMASQYGKSGKEAADAMFFITSAGLRGADAMETLEASLKGAAIGLGDVQTIADLATSAMNAYGPSVLSATKATSILRTAVEQGKLESSELASAMGSVLPVASALGVGFDEAAAAMAAMSRTGTGASEASTQLRGILAQLTKETPKGAKALASVGLSYEGLRKQIREEGLLSTLQTLVGAFDGNTIATAAFFGNVRALTGIMDLMGAGAETTKDIFGALADTTAEDLNPALEAAAETTGFKLRQAFATMKNSLIEFGDIIAPFVQQFAERLAAIGTAFQNLSPQTKQFIVRAAAIAAAVGPVLIVVGKVVGIIGGFIKVLGLLFAAFNPVTIAIGAIVFAIGLMIAAVNNAWRTSEPFRNAVRQLWSALQDLGRIIADTVSSAFRTLTGNTSGLQGTFSSISRVVSAVLTVAVQYLTGVIRVLGGAFQVAGKVFEVGVTIFRMVANVIKGVVMAAIDILFNKLGPVSAAFRGLASGVSAAFSRIGGLVSAAFNKAASFIEGFVNIGINAINAIIRAYNKLATVLPGMSQIAELTEFRFNQLSAATEEVSYRTYAATANMDSFNRQGFQQANTTARLAQTADLASSAVKDLANNTKAATGSSKGNTEQTKEATKALDKYKEKFNEVANRLKSAREEIERDYQGMVQAVQGAIMGGIDLRGAVPEYNEAGERVGKSFIEKLTEQAEKAKEFAAKIRHLITQDLSLDAMKMVLAAGVEAGTNIANELIAGGSDAIAATNQLIDTTKTAADDIGIFAADSFFGTGLALAKKTEAAFVKRFGEGGPGWNKMNQLMNHLAKSLNRTSTITVVTRHVSEGIPGRRMGGPVAAGSPYIVGEGGPELFVPTMTGRIIPNHDLGKSMTGRSAGVSMAAGGSVINLTVNAGMGTQGAEVGRQIVEAIRSYERKSGRAFAAA
jgi:TP901 family phage tail tape measure protein